MPKFINPPGNPGAQYGLSSAAVSGEYMFAAGMALDFDTLQRSADAVEVADETRICLAGIEAKLNEAGFALTDIVKTTCWLSDESHRMEFIQAYRDYFGDGPYPARCSFVAGLAGGCRVEIDAVAFRSA
ncbi:MAG: RidA family protein [Verrucomicrobia bacterium]|nr:RidA family protein [Verrucomicrobiota bacterium]